jgi:hypothetical protein
MATGVESMAKTTEQATMTVTTTVASDPVFAVIEAHRVADADSNAINDEYFQVASKSPHGRRGPERRAIRALVDSRPATMQGAHTLIAYLGTVIRARDPRVW